MGITDFAPQGWPQLTLLSSQRHLTNIKLGKQSPYCKVIIGKESRKTAVVQRGGQHPECSYCFRFSVDSFAFHLRLILPLALSLLSHSGDHQLEKFEIFEDMEDVVARTASGAGSDAVSADGSTPTKRKRKVFDKGVRTLRIECYADHPREPELIGSEVFDLAKVLNTGEDEGQSSPSRVPLSRCFLSQLSISTTSDEYTS